VPSVVPGPPVHLLPSQAIGEISGIGGVAKASDAIEHLLLGASTVQACTGPMLQGHDSEAAIDSNRVSTFQNIPRTRRGGPHAVLGR
jgi:hypothetical protein